MLGRNYNSKKERFLKSFGHCVIILVAAIIAYSNSFTATFHFDDFRFIPDNPLIRDFNYFVDSSNIDDLNLMGDIKRYFKTRSVGFLSFWLNYKLGGFDLRFFHVGNLAIHYANAILIYLFVVLVFRTPLLSESSVKRQASLMALFAGLLFVVHPLQTEAVTYILSRLVLLAAMFYLLSMVAYIGARISTQSISRYGLYLLSIVSAVLGMKTKENVFTLPVAIALCEVMYFRSSLRKRVLLLIPFILTMLIIPLTYIGLNLDAGRFGSAVSEATRLENALPRLDYMLTQFTVIVSYIRLLLLPINQNVDYDHPAYHSFLELPVIGSVLFLSGIVVFGIYLFNKSRVRDRVLGFISFGIFWFFLTLAVESTVLPISELMVEYRVYLPSIGFFFALVTAGCILFHGIDSPGVRKIFIAVQVFVVFVFISATYARNNIWQNEIILWEDVIKKSPRKARGYVNLGKAYADKGLYDRAIELYLYAIELDPDYKYAYINLGAAYIDSNLPQEAIKHLQTLLTLAPDYPEAHNNLGNAYQAMGRLDEAIENYQQELRHNPSSIKARYNLGITYMKKGMADEAIEQYNAVLEIKQGFIDVHYRLGNVYLSNGMFDKAIEHYKAVVTPRPDLFSLMPIRTCQAEAHYNMGYAYESKGLTDIAIEQYKAAIRLAPYNVDAYNNLGIAYMSKGMTDVAIENFKTVFKLDPDNENAYFNLGKAYVAKGNVDKAIEYYAEFLKYRPDYAEAHFNIGAAYEAKGLPGKAEEHYRRALALNPDYEEARKLLDRVDKKTSP